MKIAAIEDLVRAQQEQRQRDFAQPDFEAFSLVYQRDISRELADLYSLRDLLSGAGGQFKEIWVEGFHPLSARMIRESANKYNRRFYQFSFAGEGQGLLASITDPRSIWIDYDSNGKNIEQLPATLDQLIAEIRERSS